MFSHQRKLDDKNDRLADIQIEFWAGGMPTYSQEPFVYSCLEI